MNATRAARWLALLACAALLAAPWRGHIDDFDAQLYLVVARNLARDHAWFNLRYLPSVFPVFRDHLPFGFWPAAAAIRLFGEWAVPAVYALMMLGAVAAAGRIAERIGGARAGVAAILLLGTCESIWQYGGRLLLEPPLLLLATLAAGAALANRWTAAALFGALAALIKGPFGLLPLACVAAARLPERRGALAALAAALPLAAFLLVDPAGGWRTAYLHGQLLASAAGARPDGVALWWFPLAVIAHRFWPGFPFALLGAWRARREPALRPLAVACALMVALLCLPARKWGNHAYVAFPLLAGLGGAAVAPWLAKVRLTWVAGVAAAVALAFSLSGLGARLLRPPCAFSTSLREPLAALPPGRDVVVVSKLYDAYAQLAAERDLVPWPVSSLPDKPSLPDAVVTDDTPVPPAWAVVGRGGGFLLLRAR
jgi:4-amino-4-deoxy-L-arabinose transferase-like glycosyltransferase